MLTGQLATNALEQEPNNFDPQRYLELNPDVKEADLDPKEHFLKFGAKENRPW
jgi:hypothetical protein